MNELEFIKHNISSSPYELARFAITDYYPRLVIDESKISEHLKERAKNDLNLFAEIEKNRFKNKQPIVGDAIIKKSGGKTFIGILTYDGNFQDTAGGSFCIHERGASYSGGFTMDVLNIKNLKLTREKTPLHCWIFSGKSVGGNRGVYNTINVRTWKEV